MVQAFGLMNISIVSSGCRFNDRAKVKMALRLNGK
jgi:hypothetical protein